MAQYSIMPGPDVKAHGLCADWLALYFALIMKNAFQVIRLSERKGFHRDL